MVPRRDQGNPQLADQQGEAMKAKGGVTMKHAFALLALGLGLQFACPALASDATTPKTIVFVCLHGSVKSQMAAAHFNRIAREHGLPYTAISRGIQVDTSIPARIRDALNLDGLAPLDDVPRPLTAAE